MAVPFTISFEVDEDKYRGDVTIRWKETESGVNIGWQEYTAFWDLMYKIERELRIVMRRHNLMIQETQQQRRFR